MDDKEISDSPYVRVTIDNISLSKLGFIVFLRHDRDDNVLPICIGAAEANSIAAAFNQQESLRPLSHDLFKSVLSQMDCTVDKVHVTELVEGTFYARIFMTRSSDEQFDIDSRPSDAIALALRFDAPIWVHRSVLDLASVSIGQIRDDEQSTPAETLPKDPVERMRAELKKAVEEERYEDAARIRDQLQSSDV